MRNVLLDTGPLVALLDKSERNHLRCVEFFKDFEGRLITTEPVLTEVLYLLQSVKNGVTSALRFVLEGGAILVPASTKSLARCLELVEKYSDIPMDFADASLVVLAEQLNTQEIFTLDLRGFGAYRFYNNKGFVIYPQIRR